MFKNNVAGLSKNGNVLLIRNDVNPYLFHVIHNDNTPIWSKIDNILLDDFDDISRLKTNININDIGDRIIISYPNKYKKYKTVFYMKIGVKYIKSDISYIDLTKCNIKGVDISTDSTMERIAITTITNNHSEITSNIAFYRLASSIWVIERIVDINEKEILDIKSTLSEDASKFLLTITYKDSKDSETYSAIYLFIRSYNTWTELRSSEISHYIS